MASHITFIRDEVVKLHKSKPKSLKMGDLRGALLAPLHIITACILGLLREFSSYQKEAFIILASISSLPFLPLNEYCTQLPQGCLQV